MFSTLQGDENSGISVFARRSGGSAGKGLKVLGERNMNTVIENGVVAGVKKQVHNADECVDSEEDEVFFGKVCDDEAAKAKKLRKRRRTMLYKLTVRAATAYRACRFG